MIERKEKPCKGINKAKSYKGCGEKTLYRTFGLCNNCLGDFLFGNDNGKVLMQKSILPKAKSIIKKEQKAKDKKLKENITKWDSLLRAEIQKICRLIDFGLPCIARGTRGQMHGGHVYAVGGNKTMSYNCHNIHRQSAYSNHFQNDDGLLREGIEREYGKGYLEFISNLRRTKALNYSNEEYHQFYLKARQISLKLSKNKHYYSLLDRIKLRNEINIDLGIYKEEYCVYTT